MLIRKLSIFHHVVHVVDKIRNIMRFLFTSKKLSKQMKVVNTTRHLNPSIELAMVK